MHDSPKPPSRAEIEVNFPGSRSWKSDGPILRLRTASKKGTNPSAHGKANMKSDRAAILLTPPSPRLAQRRLSLSGRRPSFHSFPSPPKSPPKGSTALSSPPPNQEPRRPWRLRASVPSPPKWEGVGSGAASAPSTSLPRLPRGPRIPISL